MAGAPLVPTRYPGIYRRGDAYVYRWRDAEGKMRQGTARTLGDAREAKATQEARAAEGAPAKPKADTGPTLARYARELFGADLERAKGKEPLRGSYTGRRRAIRDRTRAQYRQRLEQYWLPALGRKHLSSLSPVDCRSVLTKLSARDGDDYLTDRTLREIWAPMSVLIGEAVDGELIEINWSRSVRLPSGRDDLRRAADPLADEDDELETKALTRQQLATLLAILPARHRPLFRFMAVSGMRYSEVAGLYWRDLKLDGSRPVARVRRSWVRGTYGPPKTRSSRREVPLTAATVCELRAWRKASEWPRDQDVVFPSNAGTPIPSENLRNRVLRPAAEEAGVSWIGLHTFRHTAASMLIDQGKNIRQVSAFLGHQDPGFTLRTYAWLMDDGVGEGLDLDLRGHVGVTNPATLGVTRADGAIAETLQGSDFASLGVTPAFDS